jgi:hypothetical protein
MDNMKRYLFFILGYLAIALIIIFVVAKVMK